MIVFIVIIWVAISSFMLISSLKMWPPFDGDASSYTPPMLTYAKDNSLTNPIWAELKLYDPAGKGRFITHGFLYQMIVGSLAPSPTYKSIIPIIAIFNILTLGVVSLLFYRSISVTSGLNIFWKGLIVTSAMLGISTSLYGDMGRPEIFATLIVGILACSIIATHVRWHWVLIAIAIGTLGCSHPVGGILLAAFSIVYMSIKFPGKLATTYLFSIMILSLSVFSLFFLWYPYSLTDWIIGNLNHASRAVIVTWKANAFYFWLVSPRRFFYGVIYMLGVVSAIYLYLCFKTKIQTKWLFLCGIFLLSIISYYFGIRVAARNYNLMIFAAWMYALIIYTLGFWFSNSNRMVKSLSKISIVIVIIGIFLISSLGFLRKIVLFADSMQNGMNYDQARKILSDIRNNNNGVFLLTKGLFTLTEDYDDIILEDVGFFRYKNCDFAVYQQANRSKTKPPQIDGFQLIKNFYSSHIPKFLGIKIANTVKGYNFAVYKKKFKKSYLTEEEGFEPSMSLRP